MNDVEWYWCLTHQRAESADDRDDVDNSLGPYESPEAAAAWKARSEERADKWAEDDEAWFGDSDRTEPET